MTEWGHEGHGSRKMLTSRYRHTVTVIDVHGNINFQSNNQKTVEVTVTVSVTVTVTITVTVTVTVTVMVTVMVTVTVTVRNGMVTARND